MNDLRVIWTSGIIPNGPAVIRSGMPEEARQIVYDYLLTQHETDRECYTAFSMGEGQGWVPVGEDHAFYEGVITMREATTQSR